MRKRGQLTVFILLGLLLFVSFSIILLVNTNADKQNLKSEVSQSLETLSIEETAVRNKINFCLDESIRRGVILFGRQGGYMYDQFFIPTMTITDFHIPMYTVDDKKFIPTIDYLEDVQIEEFVYYETLDCINDFIDYNFIVELGNLSVDSKLKEEGIEIKFNLPYNINSTNKVLKNKFKVTKLAEGKYLELYEAAKKIAEFQLENPGMVIREYLEELFNEGIYVDIMPFDENIILFNLMEQKGFGERDYVFQFATYYEGIVLE